jgi:hypothetical protein
MADNTGQAVQSFRMRKLHVTAPPSLAQTFVQMGIFDEGTNLADYCGEGGSGGYSWLLQVDPSAGTLETGGAPLTGDPFGVGYCFVDATIGAFPVAPVTTGATQAPDGSWSSAVIPELHVPLFVNGDPTNVMVLPLTKLTISQVSVSTDDNCIGSYNPDGVTAPTTNGTCQDQDPSSCERWHTAGAMGGFITLKEADTVLVQELGKSLCVLLTDGTSTTNGGMSCAKDASGNITAQGDFCSTTDSPGGCQDSSWFAATFAASAAKVTSGSSVSWCNGAMAGDGG